MASAKNFPCFQRLFASIEINYCDARNMFKLEKKHVKCPTCNAIAKIKTVKHVTEVISGHYHYCLDCSLYHIEFTAGFSSRGARGPWHPFPRCHCEPEDNSEDWDDSSESGETGTMHMPWKVRHCEECNYGICSNCPIPIAYVPGPLLCWECHHKALRSSTLFH